MTDNHFKTSIRVEQSPSEVFKAINNVRGWWSESIVGNTLHKNDEFFYHYKDVHLCKLKIEESVPEKRVHWRVLENEFNFTKDKTEWTGNQLIFEISREGNLTRLDFTQIGLVPDYECYQVCSDAWTSYINGSLKSLITTDKGKPNTKENDLNQELIQKWGLPNK